MASDGKTIFTVSPDDTMIIDHGPRHFLVAIRSRFLEFDVLAAHLPYYQRSVVPSKVMRYFYDMVRKSVCSRK